MRPDRLEGNVAQAQRQLRDLADALPDILRRGAAGSAQPDGLNRTGDGGGRSTAIADPTGNAVVGPVNEKTGEVHVPPDLVALYVRHITSSLDLACGQVNAAAGWRRKLDGLTLPPRETNVLECANPACSHVITRVGDDRPRNGRCPRCAKYLLRHDRDWNPRQTAGTDECYQCGVNPAETEHGLCSTCDSMAA